MPVTSMFRFIVFTIALTVVLADDKHKCHKLFHPGSLRCCKTEIPPPEKKEDLEECFKMPPNPHSCEHDICVGKKRGFASDDGTINKDAFEKIIEQDFKSSPTLVEAIKENCIKGDVTKMGPPDACELAKMHMCTHKMMVLECKDWDDTGSCTGMKDLVRECAKMDE